MLLGVSLAGGINIMQTHLIPLYLVMGWIITRRFAQSLTEAERLNGELSSASSPNARSSPARRSKRRR